MCKKCRQHNDTANFRKNFTEQELKQRYSECENEKLSEFDPYVE
jgi:hypothetical protein